MFLNVLIIINFSLLTQSERNNVCKSIADYDTIEANSRCYYNFAANKPTPEVIILSGYPVEVHKIHTSDGYTLVLHRIPNQSKQRSPVLLQHGFISASNFYVAKGNDSLAFMLASAGYDVWMGNFRGNVYSYKHDNLTVADMAFWDYTLDDIALKDLPQTLKYIAKISKSEEDSTIYIGHSLGCIPPLLFASEFPKEAKRLLKIIIMMAPAYSIKHTTSILSLLAKQANNLNNIVRSYNLVPLLSSGNLAMQLTQRACSKEKVKLCYRLFKKFVTKMNTVTPEMFPVVFNVVPKGGSINLAVQLATTISKPLSKFDYGKTKNNETYGSNKPPEYFVEKVKIPVHIIAARSDNIISFKDALELYNKLSPTARSGFYTIPSKYFTHADFGLGKYIKELLNDYILEYLYKNL